MNYLTKELLIAHNLTEGTHYFSTSIEAILDAIVSNESLEDAGSTLGFTYKSFKYRLAKYIKPLFPDKKNNSSWRLFLLLSIGYRYCTSCKDVLVMEEFHTKHGVPVDECKLCSLLRHKEYYQINKESILRYQKEYYSLNKDKVTEYKHTHYVNNRGAYKAKAREYQLRKVLRTTSWSEFKEIESFYKSCPEGYHVDHIIPLFGEKVSGLHVLSNLQYLTAKDNLVKSNKYEP